MRKYRLAKRGLPEDVRYLRRSSGLTRNKLANRMSISPTTIKSWESGARNPSEANRKLLAICCNHRLWKFLLECGFEENKPKSPFDLDLI